MHLAKSFGARCCMEKFKMGLLRDLGRHAWRKWKVDGVSASGAHPPTAEEIFAFVDAVDLGVSGAAAGLVRSATLAGLPAGTRVGQPGEVTGDNVDKGAYTWNGSAWVKVGELIDPETVVALNDRVDSVEDERTATAISADGDLQLGLRDEAGNTFAGWRKSDGRPVAATAAGLKPYPSPQLLDPLSGRGYNTYGALGQALPGSTGNPVNAALKDSTAIFVLVLMGQSLMEGMNNAAAGTDLPFSTTNDRPSNVLMLNTGRYVTDGQRGTSFVPLVESDSGFGPRETMSYSMARHLLEFTLFATGVQPTILVINAAKGGRSLRQLKRGSSYWANMLQGLRDAQAIAEKQGRRLIAVPVWSQGQAEYNEGGSVAETEHWLRTMLRGFREDVHAITLQREFPPMFLDVFSNSIAPNDIGSSAWPQAYKSFLEGQPTFAPAAIAAGNLWNDPNFCVVGTDYQFSRSGLNNTFTGIHLDSHGYFLKGQMFARAIYAELFGPGWMPTRIIKAEWYSTTQLDVWFSRNIIVDTAGQVTPPDSSVVVGNYLGLKYWDSSGSPPTITGHAMINDKQRLDAAYIWNVVGNTAARDQLTAMAVTGMRLTLSGASTGVRKSLNLATYKDGFYLESAHTTQCPDGPAHGARSCIRAVEPSVSLPTDQWGVGGHFEYDWAIPQMINLTGVQA
ncbi:hypothetical protein EPK99_06370 [Neorhizobium lilium]|uniref:Sialate O-acetylesterase domain-containing protein n=1 Tax=Neorhizobium lilium TaxID=2503024 RepID=A0A3S3RUB6_9HYPH|nr:sialate O-acetylesterase [Neorhizobium lilium]RWX78254.1 hypothetical protein EPK99_06370 [Neorhizobium lilium]